LYAKFLARQEKGEEGRVYVPVNFCELVGFYVKEKEEWRGRKDEDEEGGNVIEGRQGSGVYA